LSSGNPSISSNIFSLYDLCIDTIFSSLAKLSTDLKCLLFGKVTIIYVLGQGDSTAPIIENLGAKS
jgi:hypothetical protein